MTPPEDPHDRVDHEFVPWEVIERGWTIPIRRTAVLLGVVAAAAAIGGLAIWWLLPASDGEFSVSSVEPVEVTTASSATTTTTTILLAVSEAELRLTDPRAVAAAAEAAVRSHFTEPGRSYPEWTVAEGAVATAGGWSVRVHISLLAGSDGIVRLPPVTVEVTLIDTDNGLVASLPVLLPGVSGPASADLGPLEPVPPEVAAAAQTLVGTWSTVEVLGGSLTETGWLVFVEGANLPPVAVRVGR